MDKETTEQVTPPEQRNPTGKGGFGDNPENINIGGRPKNDQRFGYWLQFFKNLTNKELLEYSKTKSNDDMFVAEIIALERVLKSRESLSEYKDLADRTEGKAQETIVHRGGFFAESKLIIETEDNETEIKPETETDTVSDTK